MLTSPIRRHLTSPRAGSVPIGTSQSGNGSVRSFRLLVLGPFLLLVSAVPWPLHALQADGMVLGRVTEADNGRPLEDVSIAALGTDRAVLSGSEGWYILSGLPPGVYEITAERFGYGTARDTVIIEPGAAISIDFQLSPEPVLLESLEVLSEPPDLRTSGHRIVIGREELEKRKASSTTQLLQGLVAGVTQTTTSGQAGASTQIRMRGGRSLEDRPPLFYVDGVRVGSGQIAGPRGTGQVLTFLDNINPADIERIEILRPPEAALLYGTDAGGGVILIFTRRFEVA